VPQQHTIPSSIREQLRRWRVLASSDDPVEASVGKRLLDAWKTTRRADEHHDDEERLPALWARVLDELADAEPRLWRGADEFKTGHALMHRSSSGTCLSVNLARGVWYCSSCHAGGDTIAWVAFHEGLSRTSARLLLRRQYGAPDAAS